MSRAWRMKMKGPTELKEFFTSTTLTFVFPLVKKEKRLK